MKYKKTELGKVAFKERNVELSARQRSAFIMFDGIKDDSEIFKSMASFGLTADDINYLVESGLIEAVDERPTSSAAASSDAAVGAAVVMTDQERYQRAYPIATKLTSALGLRGFRLNLAVEGASNYQGLLDLTPKIREAVGDEKFVELARALKGL